MDRIAKSVFDENDKHRSSKDFRWILQSFAGKAAEKCTLLLLETILFDGADMEGWYFTSKDGCVKRKNSKKPITVENVLEKWSTVAGKYENANEYVAVKWAQSCNTPQLLTASELVLCLSNVSQDVVAIQGYRQPKMGSSVYGSFEHVFKLRKDGQPQYRTMKWSNETSKVVNMDVLLNNEMDSAVKRLIYYVEKMHKCRIIGLTCTFCVDVHGDVYLCRVLECDMIDYSKKRETPVDLQMFYDTPSALQERAMVRNQDKTLSGSQEAYISKILQEKGSKKMANLLGKKKTNSIVLDSLNVSEAKERWNERRTAASTHLGSSQGKGCCGDFCSLVLPYYGEKTNNNDRLAAARDALSATELNKIMKKMNNVESMKSKLKAIGGLNVASNILECNVPFKYIAQARVEKKYVDLFIKRYKLQQDGDYLTEECYGGFGALGETFPGHYYRDVQVCKNCYQLYFLIEEARSKSKSKLALRRSGPNQLRKPGPSPTTQSSYIPWQKTKDCLATISKADIAELKSFSKPHPAVIMVITALFELIGKRKITWTNVKKEIAQSDRFLDQLANLELEAVRIESVLRVYPYIKNPLFNCDSVAPISQSAAKFCQWIRGVACAFAWKNGSAIADQTILKFLKSIESFAEIQDVANIQPAIETSKEEPIIVRHHDTKTKDDVKVSLQKHQMERLAKPIGADAGKDLETVKANTYFTCKDGVTGMPYAMLGQADLNSPFVNLIVFHDFFDTHDATQILFRSITAKHLGCRALLFNYPGQSGTAYPAKQMIDGVEKSVILSNNWISRKIEEMLVYLNESGKFNTDSLPFHIVGFGNGANIATAFSILYQNNYPKTFKSLILFNGFATVDAQLAAILHSSTSMFSCFPSNRPDLPVSYFTKFIFSDNYLKKVDPNLALNIYTAVTNSITLEGRIAICSGALHHEDLTSKISQLEMPLVLFQSVDNSLVHPSNVDIFLNARECKHIWSHQQTKQIGMNEQSKNTIAQALQAKSKAAVVMWMQAGHEVRQETKSLVVDCLSFLAHAKHAPTVPSQKPTTTVVKNIPINVIQSDAQSVDEKPLKKSSSQPSDPTNTSKDQPLTPTSDLLKQVDHSSKVSALLGSVNEEPSVKIPVGNDLIKTNLQIEHISPTPVSIQPIQAMPIIQINNQPLTIVPLNPSLPIDDISDKQLHLKKIAEMSSIREALIAEPVPDVFIGNDVGLTKSAINEQAETTKVKEQQLDIHPLQIIPEQEDQNDQHVHDNFEKEMQKHRKTKEESMISNENINTGKTPDISGRILDSNLDDNLASIPSLNDIPPCLPNLGALPEKKPLVLDPVPDIDANIDQVAEKITIETETHAEAVHAKKLADDAQIASQLDNLREQQKKRQRKWEDEDDARLRQLEEELYGSAVERHATTVEVKKKIAREEQKLDLQVPIVEDLCDTKLSQPLDATLAIGAKAVALPSDSLLENEVASLDEVKEKSLIDMMNDKSATIPGLEKDDADQVKYEMMVAHRQRTNRRDAQEDRELNKIKRKMAKRIQARIRGILGRKKVRLLKQKIAQRQLEYIAAACINRHARGYIGRKYAARTLQRKRHMEARLRAAVNIQRVFRGFQARKAYHKKLHKFKAILIQRTYRGYCGRKKATLLRNSMESNRHRHRSASKIQAAWRMRAARDHYLESRVFDLAALDVQRVFRGYVARKRAKKMRTWQNAQPGPERIQLGLAMVEETKKEHTRQQNELDALHKAQELAEKRVSQIHVELLESENEMSVLEKELQEIDQIEHDLQELVDESETLHARAVTEDNTPIGSGISQDRGHNATSYGLETKEEARKRQAEKYAVEMAIQLKHAEREQKKNELEAEFTSVLADVQKKRAALADLESKISDMESTRLRKDRECARLQRDLMELVDEQRYELELIREKGIELETAVSTSAAASAAAASKQAENAKRSQAMFESSEELMKFQFMSMSLSYMGSLGIIKNLRELEADTSKAAVAGAQTTAAAAAAAAAAANIPSMQHLKYHGTEMLDSASKKAKRELAEQKESEEEAKAILHAPFPSEIVNWTITDVSRWLDTLSLSQYKDAFREGAVDGEFLMELRPEDMSEVLGMTHKLHVRKVVLARNKLLPLSALERSKLESVIREDKIEKQRSDKDAGLPDDETVFSQARNGRLKRLTASLEAGFDVSKEDDHGNTLLCIACQNVNFPMVELLLNHRSNINHKNSGGNTPLHFAMAYDKEGTLGEYLIQHGADDSIENESGNSPYDGL